ncbi:MAG: L-threonine 3-dehydrogenase [Candidatus Latescibacteria bacterium]|nr:L-threonine 3-dehydrogenase [Candidatus Latescibacterota bacterium]
MKALVKEQPGKGLTLKEVDIPEPGEEEVLVRIRAAGICGTDVHIYDWDTWSQQRIHPPVITGHELVGEVAALGKSVRHISIGQRVSAEGHIACGQCEFCRTGQAHICRDVEIIGVDRNGCFAEYMSIYAGNLWPVPDAIPDHIASIFDPIGNAMHTVMAEPVAGKSVMITGAGAIGLFAVAIAKSAGASNIIVIEPNAFKRESARKVGAQCTIDPSEKNLNSIVLDHTDGLGPQILLEMSGHPGAIKTGLHLLRNGGCACVLGIPSKPVDNIDWAKDIVFKGITIKAINGRRMYDTWFQSQDFMLREQKAINKLITHRLPFGNFEHGFELLHNGEAIKVVLEMV